MSLTEAERRRSDASEDEMSDLDPRYPRRKFGESSPESDSTRSSGEVVLGDGFGRFVESETDLKPEHKVIDDKTFEIQFNLEYIPKGKVTGPVFQVGGSRWNMIVVKGKRSRSTVYLASLDSSSGSQSICGQFVATLNGEKGKEECYRFNKTRQFKLGKVDNESNVTIRIHLLVVEDELGNLWQRIDDDYDSKIETGYVGLKNQGATCYMNSLLQGLFFIEEFKRLVFGIPTETKEGPNVVRAFQKLFYNLQTRNEAVSTKELTQSFGWDSCESLLQQDVQEFNRILQDTLETKMKGTMAEGGLDKLFMGRTKRYVRCLNVPYESSGIEQYYDIPLQVKGMKSLEESFRLFIEPEVLAGDNQYNAEGYGYQDAKLGTIFQSFPPVLFLQLKRFEYDMMLDMTVKINDRYEFPVAIDLGGFLEEDTSRPYSLLGVLVHSGSVEGGHYYAYLKDFKTNKYLKFDDDLVTISSEREAVQENFGGVDEAGRGARGRYSRNFTSAYMLIYIETKSIDKIMAPLQPGEIPFELVECIEQENRAFQNRQALQDQSRLLVPVRIFTMKDMVKWKMNGIGTLGHASTDRWRCDQVVSNMYLIKANRDETLQSVKRQIEEEQSIPISDQKLWKYSMARHRIETCLEHAVETRLGDFGENLVIYLQVMDRGYASDPLLLIVKEFFSDQLRLVGDLVVESQADLRDEVVPAVQKLVGDRFSLYIENQDKVAPLEQKHGQLDAMGISTGDILVVERAGNQGTRSVINHYAFLKNRVQVVFRSLPFSCFNELENGPELQLELSLDASLQDVVNILACQLNRELKVEGLIGENIRLSGHDEVMDSAKSDPFESPYSSVMLQEALTISGEETNHKYRHHVLYYEYLEMGLAEFELKYPVQIRSLDPTSRTSISEWILLDFEAGDEVRLHDLTVENVIRLLRQKPNSALLDYWDHVDKGYSDEFRLVLVNQRTGTIEQECRKGEAITVFGRQHRVYFEKISHEETVADKVITAFSFYKYAERTHGVPFRFALKSGERFDETKKRLGLKLGLNKTQLDRCKFALVEPGTVVYEGTGETNEPGLGQVGFNSQSVLAEYFWPRERVLGIDRVDHHGPRSHHFERAFKIHN